MKKLLLATVLSMAATAVCAEPTAMLKVQGSLTSAGCVPEISNGVWPTSVKSVWTPSPPACHIRQVIKMSP